VYLLSLIAALAVASGAGKKWCWSAALSLGCGTADDPSGHTPDGGRRFDVDPPRFGV